MKTMEQLEKAYEKEMQLAEKHKKITEKHKKNATDYKKQFEQLQLKDVTQRVISLNMSAKEYDDFMKLLKSGKKSVFEAVKLVIGEKAEEVKADDNKEETAPD